MKPRTLITVAVVVWIACGLFEGPSREWRNQDLINVSWAAHCCWTHWAWEVGVIALLCWHLAGDRFGGKGGGGRD